MDIDLWHFEKRAREKGFLKIAGTDEAGRGPLAGPVVSAAVILPVDFCVNGINDSKQISPKLRISLYEEIYKYATSVGIGIVDPVEIDRINILKASLVAMSIAVKNLSPPPDYVLIDGPFQFFSQLPQEPITFGDTLSISIASASIIAKVTRDRLMKVYDEEYPQYGFLAHKGYPTKAHRLAIERYGPCPIHRRTFKGVVGSKKSL